MSRLVTSAAPVADTLSPTEVAEMKQHLVFLRRYKEVLRLKLNATEDLLVNGQREPSERGICRHLLGKVDRAVLEAAIAREPLRSDVAVRARMLEGAVRLTADVGVLLAYLETLAHVRARVEAAQAFSEVVGRIDFESLSATRVTRLLQALITTFVDHERVQVLFSLLAAPAFRRALDAAATALPGDVQAILGPLRAVHRRLVEDAPTSAAPAVLTAGLEQVLSAPDPVLRSYPEPLRIGMLELTLRPELTTDVTDRAAGVLLSSLPRAERSYARLALRRAAQLLQRRADDRARAALEELRRAQPGNRTAERWLGALGGRRLGRTALTGNLPERGRLAAAFWLDGQRPVWLRTAAAPDAERLAAEARLQIELALPAVAPVVEHGIASGMPYVVVAAPGTPMAAPGVAGMDAAATLSLAAAIVRILRALALAGVALPDAELERFLHTPSPSPLVVLADLDGSRRVARDDAERAHLSLAAAALRRLFPPDSALPDEIADTVQQAVAASQELAALVHALDQAALRVLRS